MNSKAIIEYIDKVCHVTACGFRPEKDGDPIYCFGCTRLDRKADFSMLVSQADIATEKIKFKGSALQWRYSGDGIDCKKGDVVSVSKAKKVQLLKDYPNLWEEPTKKAQEEPKEKVERGKRK